MFYKLFISFLLLISFALTGQEIEKVVILGSGPAGLTAAIYSARASYSPLLLEGEEPGGQIALSYQVDNFPGFPDGINGLELVEKMKLQAQKFGTRIKQAKVVSIDLSHRPFSLNLTNGEQILTESLIIATGASTKWLGLNSELALLGKGVCSCAVCDGFLYKKKEVVVIGGGDTAMEDALFLSKYASKVTVIHRRDQLKASKYLQEKAFANPKIKFIWNSIVEEIADIKQDKVTAVYLKNVLTEQTSVYPCQGVFVAIGHQPNTHLFVGQLKLNEGGYIITQPFSSQTSVEGVFAAGDVADPSYRQAITAAGTGCMAGIDVDHFLQQSSLEAP